MQYAAYMDGICMEEQGEIQDKGGERDVLVAMAASAAAQDLVTSSERVLRALSATFFGLFIEGPDVDVCRMASETVPEGADKGTSSGFLLRGQSLKMCPTL